MTIPESKKKNFLFILLCCSPLTNFILININQLYFFSDFFLLNIVLFNILSCLIFIILLKYFSERKNFIFIIFFLSTIWFLQFHYENFKKIFINVAYDGHLAFFVIIILSFYLTYLFLKKKIFLNFFIVFIILNIAFNLPLFVSYYSKKIFFNQNYSSKVNDFIKIDQSINLEKKKIFYIILDELPSLEYIDNELNIDSSRFKNFAISNNLEFFSKTKSNYNRTYLTITSILNFDYLSNVKYVNKDNFYPNILYKDEVNIPLLNLLDEIDFKFYFAGNEWARCIPNKKINCINFNNDNLIVKILNDYGTTSFFSNSLIGNFLFSHINSFIQKINNTDSNNSIENLALTIKNESVKFEDNSFIFVHHLSPHTPYRSKDCKILRGDERTNPNNFSSSVQCSLGQIEKITKLIIKTYPNSIIVFQGDHGHGKNIAQISEIDSSFVFNKYSIFNAIYSKSSCNENFNPSFGQVNTIRFVLRCIGFELKKVKEKSFVGFSDKQQLFGQLYEIKDY
jgi:hypothetical protein